MSKTYDTACYELAVKFLEDHYDPVPVLQAQELAGAIQDAIEDWLAGEGKSGKCEGGCTLWDCGRPKEHSGPCQPAGGQPVDTWKLLDSEFQKIFGGKKDAGT